MEECERTKFLIVDDNALNRKLMQAMLEANHILTKIACDGLEALELMTDESFDAVIMDINMPVMDGAEAVRKFRFLEEQSASRRIPIIACSAISQPEKIVEFMDAGFDRFLPKPVNITQVSDCVRWIDQQRE